MAGAGMVDGFLGRWSRRKTDAAKGKPVEAEPAQVAPAVPAAPAADASPPAPREARGAVQTAPEATPPAPTLDDVAALTPDSDFSRFAAPGVSADVKNAAMKKLFADPRYNVMDGLDVYTGDYSQPDPMPESMLRQLASAKFLGMFKDEDEEKARNGPRDVADDAAAQTVAQSHSDADPDLRLQQDDAPAGQAPGDGAERKTGAA
jgi:hypothetical protein